MRVAIVRQRYTPFGGAERFIERALPALERAGARITLITRRHEGWDARDVLTVNPPYFGNWWRDASFARAARRTWLAERFDIVQSHERIPGCDVYRAGDGVHRRWVELRRAGATPAQQIGLAIDPYHRYVMAAEKEMFEHPRLRAVICNSRMVMDEILRYFRIAPGKLHLVYNGIDLDEFHPDVRLARRDGTRAQLGLGKEDSVFLFVGSGFARKGLADALRALSGAANPTLKLLVVGRDRRSEDYLKLAARLGVADRVHMLGPRQDIAAMYSAADCLVLPTLYDPFPNVVLEAFAMGLPAIVSRSCGAAEIVETGENGWLCEPGGVEELAQLMNRAAEACSAGLMNAAARRTAERFGIKVMARQLLDLYGRLAPAGSARSID